MKCIHCGSPTRMQVQATISAPGELNHQLSKTNLRRKDVPRKANVTMCKRKLCVRENYGLVTMCKRNWRWLCVREKWVGGIPALKFPLANQLSCTFPPGHQVQSSPTSPGLESLSPRLRVRSPPASLTRLTLLEIICLSNTTRGAQHDCKPLPTHSRQSRGCARLPHRRP